MHVYTGACIAPVFPSVICNEQVVNDNHLEHIQHINDPSVMEGSTIIDGITANEIEPDSTPIRNKQMIDDAILAERLQKEWNKPVWCLTHSENIKI